METFYTISPHLLVSIPVIPRSRDTAFQWLGTATGESGDTLGPISILDSTSSFNKLNEANKYIPEFLLTTTKSTTTALWKCQAIIKLSEFKMNVFYKVSGYICILLYICI